MIVGPAGANPIVIRHELAVLYCVVFLTLRPLDSPLRNTVDILKQTIPSEALQRQQQYRYLIQIFWDTICLTVKSGVISVNWTSNGLISLKTTPKDALHITPSQFKKLAFFPPPRRLIRIIEFVNELGYPREVINLSNVTTNDMFQPWRALTTIINLCLTGKTSGFEKTKSPKCLQILCFINRAHILCVKGCGKNLLRLSTLSQKTRGISHSQAQWLHNIPPRPEVPTLLTQRPTEETVLGCDTAKVLEESLTDAYPTRRGPLPLVVFREPDTGKLQPLPEVPGKGKEKVVTPESDEKCLHGQTLGAQDEGPGWTDPAKVDEGFTAAAYPDVQENLKLTVDEQVIPEEPVSSTGTLSSLQHLAKDFSFGDQFLNDKPSEADNEKTTADTEAESMVSVTIQQDTSVFPPMTSPVIGPVPRPDSPNVHWPLPT
ncbi:hypothetical protein Tco_0806774 [Tanacetum coccineum]